MSWAKGQFKKEAAQLDQKSRMKMEEKGNQQAAASAKAKELEMIKGGGQKKVYKYKGA